MQDVRSDTLCKPWAFGERDATARLANRSGWMVQMAEGGWKVLSDCVDVDPRVIE